MICGIQRDDVMGAPAKVVHYLVNNDSVMLEKSSRFESH